MARPKKQGLDYFPLDCDNDDKFDLIESEFGLAGFAIIIKLYQKIYKEHGYYGDWGSGVGLVFAHKNGVGASLVSEIIESALKNGIFDNDMYQKYGILTSRGIQKRYFAAVERRHQIEVKNEYLLIDYTSKKVNVDINRVNADINRVNADINPQSKVKESKVKESKVNYIPPSFALPLSNGETLPITETEINNLINRYNGINVRVEFVNLRNWLEQNPEKRRSAGQTRRLIEKWMYNKRKKVTESDGINKRDTEQTGDITVAEIDPYGGIVL
jgi:hypothetical protein